MKTENLDVVIPVKEDPNNEELRFVLRSICENMPHRNVIIAGYTPEWCVGVRSIDVKVPEGLKYAKSMANTKAACEDPEVSDDFILFNDDFFVMQPITTINPVHRGSLKSFHRLYASRNFGWKKYGDGIARARKIIQTFRIPDEQAMSYELHIPMIFNKTKRLAIYELNDRFPAGKLALHTNTIYGNVYGIGGEKINDVKILDPNVTPDPDAVFISTSDETFATGRAGQYIREVFHRPCKYEKH